MNDKRSYQLSYIYQAPPLDPPIHSLIKVLYIVTKSWWNQWAEFSGYNNSSGKGPEPNQISNSGVNLENPDPAQYIFLPKVTWKRLKNWYNYDTKRIAFVRNGQPDYNFIKVFILVGGERSRDIKVPLWYTLAEFKARVTKKMKYYSYKCKFVLIYPGGKRTLLEENTKTLNELEFFDDVEVEVRSKPNNKAVSFSGVGNYNEEDDLKRAIEDSMKQTQGKVIDYEKVQEIKLKLALAPGEERYRIVIQPLKALIGNVDRILDEKMKGLEKKKFERLAGSDVRI